MRRAMLDLEGLETRQLLSVSPTFGSLVQVSSLSPFTNLSDITGQSGTVTLNSSVEPDVAVDPANPMHLVAAWQQDRWSNGGSRGIMVGVSENGGNTWSIEPLPGVTVNSGGTIQRASDPWVTIAPNGDVYVSCLPLNDPNVQTSFGVYVNQSTDGGFTWSNPVALITNNNNNLENDKDTITADWTNSNYAYAVWDRLNSGGVSNQGPGPTLFSVTSNAGQTWSAPQDILDPSTGQTIDNQIVVLPNGTLINMCVDINYNTGANDVVVIRSTDHGSTWSTPITVASIDDLGVSDPNTGAAVRTGDLIPNIAVDHTTGNLYVVWQTASFSKGAFSQIAFSMSTDGGMTWSTPIQVNQTPTNIPTADQQAFTPAVAVAANGMVAVTYYDFRNNTGASGTGLLTDYWIAYANPAQMTVAFGNEQRITNTSFNMELAPNAGGYFTGDYEAVTNGGLSFNTFGAFFCQSVSSSNPTDAFFRGAFAPNTLALGQFNAPSPVEGQSTGGTLATFSDSSPHASITDYTAVVTWGDGGTDALTSADGGIVKNADGSYSVVDTHTYAEEGSGETFSVQITDNGGGSANSSATIAVADAALHAAPAPVAAKEGAAIPKVVVATFTDSDPAGTANDYSATVNWGDGGTTASVSIVPDPSVAGQFDVVASKTNPYAEGGNYPVTVVISDAGGASDTANSTAAVADLAITASGTSFTTKEGAAFTGTVATFKDADKTESSGAYAIMINWGDSSSLGTAQATITPGIFRVIGSHVYAEAGPYKIAVTISDTGGATANASSTATVKDASLTNGAGVVIAAAHGQTFSTTVATFADMNTLAPFTDFTVTINWGDGMSSDGTVVMTSPGHFKVIGSHSYANKGSFTINVSIVDDDGSTLLVKSHANIS